MKYRTTAEALSAITDEGLFERVAAAVLREACPLCRALVHPGVNAAGKTVKAPLDGICFVPGSAPPHMVAVHHTTTALDGLRKKWLHDPAQVTPRKGKLPAGLPGDLIKTAAVFSDERKRTPDLQATLVLTTNEEPDQALVRDVIAAGYAFNISVDIWSRSRLCHELDTTSVGQWIRASLLGIEQELLSPELLHELSLKSLAQNQPQESPAVWIDRVLDDALTNRLYRDVTFLVARSGLGKTIACYRRLMAHVEKGDFGLILHHETIAAAFSLEQAVGAELCRLHPTLSPMNPSALAFGSSEQPILLVVEDINRSGQAPRLAEKIASWSGLSNVKRDEHVTATNWRLICPVWPESLSSVQEQVRKQISSLSIIDEGFSRKEGTNAVLERARLVGHPLSTLQAREVAAALGNDPLLIALHDPSTKPEPERVIAKYIENSIERASADDHGHLPADYRQALRALACEMLSRRQIELDWLKVKSWLPPGMDALISRIAHKGELLRFTGTSETQRLLFRHDRVRDWLLADGAIALHHAGHLCDDILAEPYFAEVLGAALVRSTAWEGMLAHIAFTNPLALFHAFRLCGQGGEPLQQAILQKIAAWLEAPEAHGPAHDYLRGEAIGVLAETDSREVPEIVRKFHDRSFRGQWARFRNGDLGGGIELCLTVEPGVGAPWRDTQIEHAKLRYGRNLSKALGTFLIRTDLSSASRIGALRLAGHIADPNLAAAIEACWNADAERVDHLADYLWAFAECCAYDPACYLGPVCDAWAALPDEPEKEGSLSPRDEVAYDRLRWAFQKWPPSAALDYFIRRGQQEDLRWPITYMLHGIDHPKAVLFVVQELAENCRRAAEADTFSLFLHHAVDDWRRAQENGRSMSRSSRDVLLALWQDQAHVKHLRTAALSLWAATTYPGDLDFLHALEPSDDLFDKALAQRLIRGDQQAIPEMITKLAGDHAEYWWQFGRDLWSQELTDTLDQHLTKRASWPESHWYESHNGDWIISELIIRLPPDEAEQILLKHWPHLRFSPLFVQAALYIATPTLLELVQVAVSECPEPSRLFKHLSMHWGYKTTGHPGITKRTQVSALIPYLHLLSLMEIKFLWEACNDKGWFGLRREALDELMPAEAAWRRWNPNNAAEIFDEMLKEKHSLWLEHRIDDFLKADVPWSEIYSSMTSWLDQRRSIGALQVVASALVYKGRRADLEILKRYEGLGAKAGQIIADTTFAVCRRSLC